MNILITGGTGFVGQHLVKELSKDKKNKISVVCRKKRNDFYIDISTFPNVKIHHGVDVLDYPLMEKYFKGADVVFDLAGCISFKKSDRQKLIAINRNGALNVLRACEKHNVKKLIHISSTAALGFRNKVIDEEFNFDWSKYKDKCVYSYSKSLPDKHILESKIDSILVYPPLIMGPGDKTNTPKLLRAIQKGLPFNPPGRNSVVDVRDLAKALVLLMKKDVKNDKFIISSGSYTYEQMNTIIARTIGAKPVTRVIPNPLLYPLLAAALLVEKISPDPPITYENLFLSFKNRVHSSKKIADLGFRPQYPLSQTVVDSWQWMNEVGV
ncbi:NAD-dependent epimerase/dehydratase family protein [Candidatus Woesearchaeota archaeon]|nr:NAD-dependent epimerase/dehydratase family protein [Candidatus Woesearchaeota archaeon]MBW3014044.1 NAD-dependent epimerase/dehydratase family protein [Candidatus Woesearchaeota archaeon]